MRFLLTAAKLPYRDLLLAAEALAELLVARVLRCFQSYPRFVKFFGPVCRQQPDLPGNAAIAADVYRAIKRVDSHLPGDGTCLLQARAATKMLRRRRVASVLYVGVRRDSNSDIQSHAWVKVGNIIVTGGGVHRQFSVLSMQFSAAADVTD